MMILYGLLFGLWPCAYLLLQDYTFFSEKQIRNYISLGHSVSCSIFSGCSLLCNEPSLLQSFIVYLSTSYFIWDTFYIFLKQKRTESLYNSFIYVNINKYKSQHCRHVWLYHARAFT